MNTSFTTKALCKVFDRAENDYYTEEEVTLSFDYNSCQKFLFRFFGFKMEIDGYTLLFKTKMDGSFEGIVLYKDEKIYIITNLNELINEVVSGYFKLQTFELVDNILTFDFDAANILKEENE